MTQFSWWWTTDDVGDGAIVQYDRSLMAKAARIVAAVQGHEGVGISYLSMFDISSFGSQVVNIGTGCAVVDGHPYESTAQEGVSVPAAVGGGNTRIDRIVLRCDWTAQTVRLHRIAGTDAGSPTPPAIATTRESLFDLMLYQVLVNTSGVVSLHLDEREFGRLTDPRALANGLFTADAAGRAPFAASFVNAGLIAPGAVVSDKMANLAVITSKMAEEAVITSKLADEAVVPDKVGAGVPFGTHRQGGSATNWDTPGSTSYAIGRFMVSMGVISLTLPASEYDVTTDITLPVTYSGLPITFVSLRSTFINPGFPGVSSTPLTASTIRIRLFVNQDNIAGSGRSVTIAWMTWGTAV